MLHPIGTCGNDQFQCNTHECIPLAQRCDGLRQCDEGSDEAGCLHFVDPDTGYPAMDSSGILAVGSEDSLNVVCGDRWSPVAVGSEWAHLACR